MIQTLGAVDPTLCQKIQCGLVTQSQVGWQTLLECSQAGYRGVRSALDPVCQELAGGGSVTVVREQIARSSQDPQPDAPEYYQLDPATGQPQVWYEFPAQPGAGVTPAGQAEQSEAGISGEPLTGSDELTELPTDGTPADEFDPEAYRNLIGDPHLRFRERVQPITKTLKDWAGTAIDQVKRIPWWVWLIAAAAVYETTRKPR